MRYARTLSLVALAAVSGEVLLAQQHDVHKTSPKPAATTPTRDAGRAATMVKIVAKDFEFDAPDTLTAGLINFQLVNEGADLHHIQLVKLEGGNKEIDFKRALKAGGPPPSWAIDIGGPNAAVPGGEFSASVVLEPGNYVLLCFIPAKDGVPHVMKGMSRSLTVVPAKPATRATLPPAKLTLTLSDYKFDFSAPLTRGTQTIRIRNTASQPHEFVFFKLNPGKTLQDVAQWADKPDGPPPALPIGGVTAIARGKENFITLTIDEPGTYGMICFIPDAKDGKPHHAHDMVQTITIN